MKKHSFVMLILAWISGLIGLLLGFAIEPSWFARFGSIMVLFAVMSEYTLMHKELDLLYSRLEQQDEDELLDLNPSKWHRKKVLFSHLTVVIGTLVWGFGDLLFFL